MSSTRPIWPLACAAVLAVAGVGRAVGDEIGLTTVADFEDGSIAAVVSGVKNVLAAACSAEFAAIPARGRRSLMVGVGASGADAAAICDLRYRVSIPFDNAERVAVQAWIKESVMEIRFRVSDATGAIFETPPLPLKAHNRWVRLTADLTSKVLKPIASAAAAPSRKPVWPIEIRGFRIHVHKAGRHTVYLDDLEVEQRVNDSSILRGEFEVDSPTHLYEPGAPVYADLILENISLRRALSLKVQLQWLDAAGAEVASARQTLNLPHRDAGFRSRQPVRFDYSVPRPGLYRLVAQVRAPGWLTPAVFETTIAGTYSNRGLPRGRETFFGAGTNLLREPSGDQLREIMIAREVGVQLLAVDTPWSLIEPDAGGLNFAPLDKLTKRVADRDTALMIILTDTPGWLPDSESEFWSRQKRLLVELAHRYGGKIAAYQTLAPTHAAAGLDLKPVEDVREAIVQAYPNALVLTPPFLAASPSGEAPPTPPQGLQLAFQTRGDSTAALATLEAFAKEHKRGWTGADRWFHVAAPLVGPGEPFDAIAVLKHYVTAAESGCAGVVWFDLRDDSADPRHADKMRGLVRRDYSPKTTLLGLANTIGMLHGLLYSGPLPGAPDEFDSALFIGGTRQVAVLFPKPNRILPAVLAPYHLVESGALSVFDFARRQSPILFADPRWTPLVPTKHTPIFIELDAERAQVDPKIGLARPWLRVPADLYCDQQTEFTIEIDAHAALRRSYLLLKLPPGAPYESSLSSRTLRADAGETLTFDVTLTRTGEAPREPIEMIVRVSLEGRSVETPIRLHQLWSLKAAKRSADIVKPDYLLGRLRPRGDAGVDAALHGVWERRNLRLTVSLPADAAPDALVRVGVALEGSDTHAEAVISKPTTKPSISPATGTHVSQLRGWRSRCASTTDTNETACEIIVPARSLGVSKFKAGTRVLLAVRYEEPRPGKLSRPLLLEWGSGLGGPRDTSDYHWIQLAGRK